MWSEAVFLDSTYVVLNAGNWEIIGVRCRKTHTFHLSNIIHPSTVKLASPRAKEFIGYGGLLIGLMLSIIRDASERALRLQKCASKGEFPDRWTRPYDHPVKPSSADNDLCLQRQKVTFVSLVLYNVETVNSWTTEAPRVIRGGPSAERSKEY